ncbi:MAG: hypothetical protein J6B81_02305 [Spirochaetaceae bacterium]|nr:hypothetical protein [Spirochaetaceae bacterium]
MDIKKIAQDYGFFLSIVVLLFLFVFLLTFFAADNWNEGLKEQLTKVLEESFPQEYIVSDMVSLPGGFSTLAVAYELQSAQENKPLEQREFCMIVRVSTLFGPMAAVYKYSNNVAEFISVINIQADCPKENVIINSIHDSFQIKFWLNRIPNILSDVERKIEEEQNE